MSEKINDINELVKNNIGIVSTPNYSEYIAIHDNYVDFGYKAVHNQFGCLNYLNTDNYKASLLSCKINSPNNTSTFPELYLFHPESNIHSNCIMLRVYKDPLADSISENNQLLLTSKGFFYNNKSIDTIHSFGDNYIQYTNGLGICWVKSGNTTVPPSKITFPFSFVDIPAISISPRGSSSSNISYIHKVADISSTGCIVMAVKTTTDSEYVVSNYTLIAIGMWKPV